MHANLGSEAFWIGRDKTCDWVLGAQHSAISRHHCCLELVGGKIHLTDHSRHGTAIGTPSGRLARENPTIVSSSTMLYLAGATRIELTFDAPDGEPEEPDEGVFPLDLVREGGRRRQAQRTSLDLESEDVLGGGPAHGLEDFGIDSQFRPSGTKKRDTGRREHRTDSSETADKPHETTAPDSDETAWSDQTMSPILRATMRKELMERQRQENLARGLDDDKTEESKNPQHLPVEDASTGENEAEEAAPEPVPAPQEAQAMEGFEGVGFLLDQLGIDHKDIPPEAMTHLLSEIAASYRTMAMTLRDLLAARGTIRSKLGLGGTQFDSGLNPLKTPIPDYDIAAALLRNDNAGQLGATEAIEATSMDLKKFQVALTNGVDAGFKAALDAFDPEVIEARTNESGALRLIPGTRQAELWRYFVSHYKEFAEETDDEVRSIMRNELAGL